MRPAVFLYQQTRRSSGVVCRHLKRLSLAVCSAFVTARRKEGKSGRSEEMIFPMNYSEEHEGSIEARRFPRYEIDTEIHVVTFGREKQEVMRGRALNILGFHTLATLFNKPRYMRFPTTCSICSISCMMPFR